MLLAPAMYEVDERDAAGFQGILVGDASHKIIILVGGNST